MPDMDRLDTTKEYSYKNIPIVALTSNAILGSKGMFLENSMNDFLSKPIDFNKLNQILEKWINNDLKEHLNEENQSKDYKTSCKEKISLNLVNIDYKSSMEKNKLDINSYIDILKIFYMEGKDKIKSLVNYLKKDLKTYTIHVHDIKSSSASIIDIFEYEKAYKSISEMII